MTGSTANRRVVSAAILTAGLCAVVTAQKPSDVIRWTAAGPESPVKAGGTASVQVTADIDPGWHLYAFNQPSGGPRSLEISAAKSAPITVVTDKIDAPPPKIQHDPNFNLETRYYDEQTTIVIPVRVAAGEAAATRRVSLSVTFQACTERICLRPYTETVSFDIAIAGEDRGRRGERRR